MPPTSTVTPLPLIIAVAATLTFAACSATPASDAAHAANLAAAPAIDSAQNEAAARHAKVAYLAGINSNDLEQFLATISDDVVYVAPNAAAIVGKEAVTAWVRDYMAAYIAYRLSEPNWYAVDERQRTGFHRHLTRVLAAGRTAGELRDDIPLELSVAYLQSMQLAATLVWLQQSEADLAALLRQAALLFLEGAGVRS